MENFSLTSYTNSLGTISTLQKLGSTKNKHNIANIDVSKADLTYYTIPSKYVNTTGIIPLEDLVVHQASIGPLSTDKDGNNIVGLFKSHSQVFESQKCFINGTTDSGFSEYCGDSYFINGLVTLIIDDGNLNGTISFLRVGDCYARNNGPKPPSFGLRTGNYMFEIISGTNSFFMKKGFYYTVKTPTLQSHYIFWL